MAKEKKAPKTKSDGIMSKDAETILVGLMISLIAIIGLLNRGPVGEFLTFCFVYLFGVFYFVAYLIMLFFGIYLALKRKAFKVQVDISLLGMILLFVGIIIAASPGNGDELRLSNVFSKFSSSMNNISTGVLIQNIAGVEQAGGGLIGYFLAALLNTTITSIGTMIVSFILMAVGLALCLYRPALKIKALIKKHKEKKKQRLEALEKEKKLEEEELAQTSEEEENEESLSYVTSDPDNTATKARFVFGEEETPTSDVLADDIEEDEEIIIPEGPKDGAFDDEIEQTETQPTLVEHQEATVPTASKVTYRMSEPSQSPLIKTQQVQTSSPSIPETPYVYPSLDLLNVYENEDVDEDNIAISNERQQILNELFEDFGIGAVISGYTIGASVTRFDVRMNRDVSVTVLDKYVNDISSRLGGISTVLQKVVLGKSTSGLEVANAHSTIVPLKDCLAPLVDNPKYRFYIPFGTDVSGKVITADLTRFPHILIAGATGNGKSVFLHSLIMSLIMKNKPSELKLLLFDPKQVEMSMYRDVPHLLCPIIDQKEHMGMAFNKLIAEMEERYSILKEACVSSISQYNKYAERNNIKPLPYIVAVVDELADIMETNKNLSSQISQLAGKARACGIHLVIATQRPSTDVISGVIKGNLTTRVALKVPKQVDSITILGEKGAEKLIGRGDMLVDCPDLPGEGFTRVQSPLVEIEEINRVVGFLKENYPLEYNPRFLDLTDHTAAGPAFPGAGLSSSEKDEYYDEVKAVVMDLEDISISELQRKFGFGFNKAARLIDQLEAAGVVSKPDKENRNRRKVLIRNQSALGESEPKDE